ncbi:MAG: AAA family ATPase [Candidatus Saccharimonas sp.]
MSFYYITGVAGSGKSLVRKELTRLGYEAYDTDENNLGYFYHNTTGETVQNNLTSDERTPEWVQSHTWKLSRIKAEKLTLRARNKTVFLCGAVANDATELWDLFDKVFALTINEEVLVHRIKTRTSNDFGKSPHEMANIMKWQSTAKETYTDLGAVIIDATQSIDHVTKSILGNLSK